MSQCHTCAFRPGSVTHDKEPYNALRGLVCALGARPFHCHHLNGEDHHGDQQYLIQRLPQVRRFLQKVHAELDSRPTLAALEGETLKLCEGWKEAVREYKARHFFDDPAIRHIRRRAGRLGAEGAQLDRELESPWCTCWLRRRKRFSRPTSHEHTGPLGPGPRMHSPRRVKAETQRL